VQDAAHGTLLRGPRRKLHAQIAEALETHFPQLIDSQPELFAQHYAEAGLIEKSIVYWGKAGHRSAARSAMAEAAAQFQKGLDQIALLPATPERRRQELEFWSALGAVLQAVKGFAAPETGHAYARALELWKQLGSPSEFLGVPLGQSRYHAARGELEVAQHLDEDLLRLSRERDDTGGLVLGHQSSGRILLSGGRFAASRSHLEAALALYDPISHRALVHQAGIYPQVTPQAVLGIVLFCLGYPDQALARSHAATSEASRLAHPPSLAASLYYSTTMLSLFGETTALDKWADELGAMASEQAFPLYQAQGTICRGWVKVKNGDVSEGMSLLRAGSIAYRATGMKLWMPYHMTLVAMGCEIAGQINEALAQ
jgi:predicted ATPase